MLNKVIEKTVLKKVQFVEKIREKSKKKLEKA